MSKHNTSGNRISKQNYCYRCQWRVKNTLTGKVNCINDGYVTPISEAMGTCLLLTPFDKYKEEAQKKQGNK